MSGDKIDWAAAWRNVCVGRAVPRDGNFWCPYGGGYFTAAGDWLYWESGRRTRNRGVLAYMSITGDDQGEDYSKTPRDVRASRLRQLRERIRTKRKEEREYNEALRLRAEAASAKLTADELQDILEHYE